MLLQKYGDIVLHIWSSSLSTIVGGGVHGSSQGEATGETYAGKARQGRGEARGQTTNESRRRAQRGA